MDSETQFLTELFEQGDVAAAFVAERKICADAYAVNASQIAHEITDECFAGLFAEDLVEVNQEQSFGTERFKGAELLRQRINQRRHAVRRDNGVRMLVERENERERVVLSAVGDGLADDLLMAEMHAVEEADGEADLFTAGLQLGGGV